MDSVTVKVETQRLDAILNGLNTKAEAVLDIAANHVRERWLWYIWAKQVIDTGAYANSIHIEDAHPPFERTVGDGVEYGIYQELGHHTVAARPCATPALEDERKYFLAAWEALFK